MGMLDSNKDFEVVREILEHGGVEDDFEDEVVEEDDLSYELMLIRRSSLFKGA